MRLSNPYLTIVKEWVEQRTGKISVTGLPETARAYFLSELLMETERPCCIILPKAGDAGRFFRELEFFLPESSVQRESKERRLYDFPLYDISPLTGLSPHRNIINRRLQSLYALTSSRCPIIVTSLEAILFRIIPKEALIGALEYLEPGEEIRREDLLLTLERGGYLHTSLVEEEGDYSVRGSVIDVFPPLYSSPMRLDFWGDRLESIRSFNPVTQRSSGHLTEMILLPSSEIIMDEENMKRARSMGRLPDQITDGNGFPGQEAWLNHFYSHPDTFFEYFPSDGIIVRIDQGMPGDDIDRLVERISQSVEKYRGEAEERGTPFPEMGGIILSRDEIVSIYETHQVIDFNELALDTGKTYDQSIQIRGVSGIDNDLEIRIAGKGRVSMAPLAEKVSQFLHQGGRVILVCRTEQQAERLREILTNYGVDVGEVMEHWQRVLKNKRLGICLGRLSKGFIWTEIGVYVISEDEIFGPKRARARSRGERGEGGIDWTSFSQLKVGDLVVHEDHGIGRYGGLIRMDIEKKSNDFAIIDYAGNDRLYIPADRLSILQKYIGADERNPKLDALGGRSWNLAKQKAKKSIKEIAKQLVEIYALRKYRDGFAFSLPDNYFREFEATFEHEETPDQIKAIDEVLSDMEADTPMDRLVCGDVGFGKTEVAIRAAFKAVMDGKQAAMLVPTTVLAEQHYETFKRRMDPYQVKVSVLSRFKSRREQKEIIALTRSGKVDVLIGTHRLLQKDISFKDLGILIIDEEQRFGVKQKERLKEFRALVDVLALTATPIPRTLYMSLMGVRDLSIIETPPEDRLAIQTYLSTYEDATIKHAIENELERRGQVFFVHNQVKTIREVCDKLTVLVPKARFAIAHGQMKEKDLEDTMMRFLQKDVDVLICTTIIESGLDIPSANTIIINDVDHFGLSQIYQLRGRVGRSTESAYAYLLLSKDARLTREAEKRLRALMDFSNLGAGIHLAMHDLKIRGGGNMLGFSQSGHISAIGYELYQKFIEQAIAELKGEEWHEEINPEINVNIPAYLPEEYVSDIDVRLNMYRRLSSVQEDADLDLMEEEIKDRFGTPPSEVINLLEVMKVRLEMKKRGVIRLDVSGKYLTLTFSAATRVSPDQFVKMAGSSQSRFKFLSGTKMKVKLTPALSAKEALLEAWNLIRELDMD